MIERPPEELLAIARRLRIGFVTTEEEARARARRVVGLPSWQQSSTPSLTPSPRTSPKT
jgi:hypothetical protein